MAEHPGIGTSTTASVAQPEDANFETSAPAQQIQPPAWLSLLPLSLKDQLPQAWHEYLDRMMTTSPNDHEKKFKSLSRERISTSLRQQLEDSLRTVPSSLWRTYSITGFRRSAGISTPAGFFPNAYSHVQVEYHDSIYDVPRNIGEQMCRAHLMWHDRVVDELLSWSASLMFAVVHAVRRHEIGQRPVYICCGSPASLKTVENHTASFFPANLVHEAFSRVPHGLNYNMFTHEYLSWGPVLDPDSSFRHVVLEKLIEEGLFELFPNLKLDGLAKRTGLYEHLMYLRKWNFIRKEVVPTPITFKDCETASRLANLFKAPLNASHGKPRIYCFIAFLALRKRRILRGDCFEKWVKEHYTVADLNEALYPSMEHIPQNLPELTQVLRLMRHATRAIGMQSLPPTVFDTSTAIHNHGYGKFWHGAVRTRDLKYAGILDVAYGDDNQSKAKREALLKEKYPHLAEDGEVMKELESEAGRYQRRAGSRRVLEEADARGRAQRDKAPVLQISNSSETLLRNSEFLESSLQREPKTAELSLGDILDGVPAEATNMTRIPVAQPEEAFVSASTAGEKPIQQHI